MSETVEPNLPNGLSTAGDAKLRGETPVYTELATKTLSIARLPVWVTTAWIHLCREKLRSEGGSVVSVVALLTTSNQHYYL
jgi:hypothetical protein